MERPLSNAKYASSEDRSTETVVLHPVAKVEEYMKDKFYWLVTFVDIEGPFDYTNYDVVEKAMPREDFLRSLLIFNLTYICIRGCLLLFYFCSHKHIVQ